MDGGKDLLVPCIKPDQPYAAGPDRLKRVHYVVPEERYDPFESLTRTYITAQNDNT